MKCPECVEQGEKSFVSVGSSWTTCMGVSSYYDEDGNYHHHDPNYTTIGYRCSRGHEWSERFPPLTQPATGGER